MPLLSACIICRNEEAVIGDCLASLRGVVDEVVVCDTGSTDRTVDIVRAAGATLVHFVWNDDFSAARNAALAPATGEWVLILDADEVVVGEQGEALRALLANARFDCARVRLHQADSADAPVADVVAGRRVHGASVALVRLFRNTPDLRWEGLIHESPVSWMQAPGRTTANVPLDLVHFGAAPAVRAEKDKDARNFRLLERHCTQNPDDYARQAYLARERMRVGDNAGALVAARQGVATVRRLVASPETRAPLLSCVSLLTVCAFVELAVEGPLPAWETLSFWHTMAPFHPNLALLEGTALLAAGVGAPLWTDAHVDRALASIERALSSKGEVWSDERMPGADGSVSRRVRAELRLLRGDTAGAWSDAQAAFAETPNDVPTRLVWADAQLAARQAVGALRAVEPLLADNVPDAWLLAADIAASFRNYGQVDVFIQKCLQSAVPWVAQYRQSRILPLSRVGRGWGLLLQLTGGRAPAPAANPVQVWAAIEMAVQQRQLGRALQLVPALLAADPVHLDAWCVLGQSLVAQRALPMAASVLRFVASVEAEHPQVRALASRLESAGPVVR